MTVEILYYYIENIKGALDKYDIYLLISNFMEELKLNQYQNFQIILPMHFILWGILWTASSSECPIDYCIVYLLKLTLKNKNARNINISSKVYQSRMQNSARSHCPCQRFKW